jgi:outer membrane protein OmpA-like peptidoglycan-associated protein
MGMVQFDLGEYDKSKASLDQYMSDSSPNEKNRLRAENLLENANFATESIEMNLDFNPRPLDDKVNTFPLQYFPVMPVDQGSILFTRRIGHENTDDEDIFIIEKDEEGNWKKPESISENINTVYNEGTCSISADGRMLIFTSCYGRETMGSCDLYVSYKSGEEWSVPKNLGGMINSGAWESQPSLGADGRTLYFISDRRTGGIGSRDIWVSYMNDDNTWTKAKNLGEPINTELDEVSPFIHPNGSTLYFSSRGHTGMGGFDIFFTELEESKWSKPVNIGYPMNTRDDQVSLFITADGARGFYSQESFDQSIMLRRSLIYEFDVPESMQVTNKSSYVRGKVYDKSTGLPLKASVELMNLKLDARVSMVNSDSVSGDYLMVLTEGAGYGLFVNKIGYLYKSLSFDLEEDEIGNPVEIDIYLEPIAVGASTILNNIFFEIDKYELGPKSKPELEKTINMMKENKGVRISIEGHTDDSGTSEYNQQLSEKRALAVRNYLTERGIEKARLEYKGWGMAKPLAPNDSEENKALNRRIEFVIIDTPYIRAICLRRRQDRIVPMSVLHFH